MDKGAMELFKAKLRAAHKRNKELYKTLENAPNADDANIRKMRNRAEGCASAYLAVLDYLDDMPYLLNCDVRGDILPD